MGILGKAQTPPFHSKLICCQKGLDVASIKKLPWMGHTLAYFPFRAMIERSQMTPFHNKLLVVVWLVAQDSKGAVELFGEDGTHYLVREGHLRER